MDILKKALREGIIDEASIRMMVEEVERKKYLTQHAQKIWKDSSGRWSTYLPATTTEKRKLIKKKNRNDLDDLIVEFYKTLEESPSIEGVFNEWLGKKLEYGEIERQSYDRYNNTFKRFFQDIKGECIGDISEIDLEDFIKRTIHDNKLTAKGWSDLRIVINGIFKYAKKNDYTDISITSFMGDLEIPRKAFEKVRKPDGDEVFTDKEVKRICGYINEHQTLIGLGIILAFKTGMRAGEIASLKYSDISGSEIHVQRTEVRYKVNGKNTYSVREATKGRDGERVIEVTKSTQELIKQIRKISPFSEYIFEQNGKRILGKSFTRRLYDICDALGIKRRSLHKCRKTYASNLINEGVDLAVVAGQLGHAQVETTLNNYYKNSRDRDEVIRMLEAADL